PVISIVSTAPATSSRCTQLNHWRPKGRPLYRYAVPAARRAPDAGQGVSHCAPPSPQRASLSIAGSAPPSPSTIVVRSATRRTPGSSGEKKASSHARTTETEKPSASGGESSVLGVSWPEPYTVADDALIHTGGGTAALDIASARAV